MKTGIRLSTSKGFQNLAKPLVIVSPAAAAGHDDGANLVAGPFEIVIHHQKVVLARAIHLLPGALETPRDGLVRNPARERAAAFRRPGARAAR